MEQGHPWSSCSLLSRRQCIKGVRNKPTAAREGGRPVRRCCFPADRWSPAVKSGAPLAASCAAVCAAGQQSPQRLQQQPRLLPFRVEVRVLFVIVTVRLKEEARREVWRCQSLAAISVGVLHHCRFQLPLPAAALVLAAAAIYYSEVADSWPRTIFGRPS